jgi:heterodisulfide reductase subunit D
MEWHIKQLEYCTYCPKMCRHVCPVSNAIGVETFIPQAKMHLLNMLRRNAIPWEKDLVAPLFACTSCRLCQKYCLHDTNVASILEMGRQRLEQRRLEHPALSRLPERFRARNERLRDKLHHEFSPHLFAEEAQVGFFPGCDTIDDAVGDIFDAFTIFSHLGLNFVRLMDSPYVCAGYPLWNAGHHDAARQVAAELIQSLRGFSTLVVGCPACTYLLREKLPQEGFTHQTEILHITEFLYIHAERLDIKQTKPAAFYHDPCYLGRYLNIYEPPRRLISRCVGSLREFFYSREESACCGGGGLVPHTYPEATLRQSQHRLQEASLFEVPLVVSSCPTCKRTLRRANAGVEVMDLLNLLAWSLSDPARPALENRPI